MADGDYTVLWTRVTVTVSFQHGAGIVWRGWKDSGSCGLSPTLVNLQHSYGVVACVSSVQVSVGEVITVRFEVHAEGPMPGTTLMTACLPSVEKPELAVIFTSDEVTNGVPVCLAVSSRNLQYVNVGRVVLRAMSGRVSWISAQPGRPVILNLSEIGQIKFDAVVVTDKARFDAYRSARVTDC